MEIKTNGMNQAIFRAYLETPTAEAKPSPAKPSPWPETITHVDDLSDIDAFELLTEEDF